MPSTKAMRLPPTNTTLNSFSMETSIATSAGRLHRKLQEDSDVKLINKESAAAFAVDNKTTSVLLTHSQSCGQVSFPKVKLSYWLMNGKPKHNLC